MNPLKTRLLYGTVLPLMVGVGVAITGETITFKTGNAAQLASNPCAARNPCNPCAARNPCNPCAAKNPCNPCAAANPCNPCGAANPCNPCNPCAAGAGGMGSSCVVPRLAKAAAKGPCAPCAPKGPCAPCAAVSPCNPCAAVNPCNPCGAKNPCNPCAATNPCGANPCAPCNPCAPQAAPELTADEAATLYGCLIKELRAAYAKSGDPVADQYLNWRRYNTTPYVSETHGNRHVNNYANGVAKAYGKFEKAGVMPVGSVLAKDSFSVRPNGQAVLGPLFIMEKMQKGFNPESGDWRNTMIMPDGNIFGTTGGKGSANVKFCYECHTALTPDTDSLFFMPAEYRAKP